MYKEICLIFSHPLYAEVIDAIKKLSSCSVVPSIEIKEGSGNSRIVREMAIARSCKIS